MIIILRLVILAAALIAGVAGITGAPADGWAATRLPLPRHGALNLSTWLTASAGAAVLLLSSHLVTGPADQRMAHR